MNMSDIKVTQAEIDLLSGEIYVAPRRARES